MHEKAIKKRRHVAALQKRRHVGAIQSGVMPPHSKSAKIVKHPLSPSVYSPAIMRTGTGSVYRQRILKVLLQTYQAIFGEWAPSSGRVIKAGPSYKVYLNDPNTIPPEKIRIDVQVPLEPKN